MGTALQRLRSPRPCARASDSRPPVRPQGRAARAGQLRARAISARCPTSSSVLDIYPPDMLEPGDVRDAQRPTSAPGTARLLLRQPGLRRRPLVGYVVTAHQPTSAARSRAPAIRRHRAFQEGIRILPVRSRGRRARRGLLRIIRGNVRVPSSSPVTCAPSAAPARRCAALRQPRTELRPGAGRRGGRRDPRPVRGGACAS